MSTRAAIVVVAALASSCIGYRAGSFVDARGVKFAGETVTVGCVDVGIELESSVAYVEPVVHYQLANRCSDAVPIDLAAIRVTGRDGDGNNTPLAIREVRAPRLHAALDGGDQTRATVAYKGGEIVSTEIARMCAKATTTRAAALAHALAGLDDGERELDRHRTIVAARLLAAIPDALARRRAQDTIDAADAERKTRIAAMRATYAQRLAPTPCMIEQRVIDPARALRSVCVNVGALDRTAPPPRTVCVPTPA